jgi:hypothetical protein
VAGLTRWTQRATLILGQLRRRRTFGASADTGSEEAFRSLLDLLGDKKGIALGPSSPTFSGNPGQRMRDSKVAMKTTPKITNQIID